MDFEYDGADDLGGRILWGRVGVLGLAVLIFFLFGRCSAGGGVDPEVQASLEAQLASEQATTAQLQADITSLQQEIVTLNAQIASADGGSTITGDGTTPTDGATTDGTTATPNATGGQIYVVKEGDTLSAIAEAVYGDPLQFGAIASANGITDTNPLQVGQELQIPANPDG
ncbi:LysM peptidoglycan-binding domain-containing protein [Euzebya rosea]|uniref:LysM peptidoglycan-binding domain-containing protein n=1 Tax=Euzebya rosea TaxID=2052804 RepID=UPI0013008D73|nr:LysM peptidoglycan-binding domain-containing protein [Euzebya rosea]